MTGLRHPCARKSSGYCSHSARPIAWSCSAFSETTSMRLSARRAARAICGSAAPPDRAKEERNRPARATAQRSSVFAHVAVDHRTPYPVAPLSRWHQAVRPDIPAMSNGPKGCRFDEPLEVLGGGDRGPQRGPTLRMSAIGESISLS